MPRNFQKSSQSRVFTIEDRAGPSHVPIYQQLARASNGVTQALGGITPVRIPDPKQYGRFITVDKIKGQPGLPTTSLEFRMTREASAILSLVRKGCPLDLQLHVGACKDPSDFDQGWEKIHVWEDADITNYATTALGAFDADQEAPVVETIDLTSSDYYEIVPIAFSEMAGTEIVQMVVDVAICDARTCGECGIPSDGCQRVLAVQTGVGASPGMAAEVVSTQNGGSSWVENNINSLPVNRTPTAAACVGPLFAVISTDDGSINYAPLADIFADIPVFVRVATGITAPAGAPRAIFSLGRTQTWIAGAGGYIYFSTDITQGVSAQTSGGVTSQALNSIHGFDDQNLIAGGAQNALLFTKNGGITWAAATAPASKAAVTINAVYMLNEVEWFLGYDDGTLWYTIDGGLNWTQRVIPGSMDHIDRIKFATRTVGYLVGRQTGVNAKILRTINGGYSWYVLPEAGGGTLPTVAAYNGLAACPDNPNLVWAGGARTAALSDGVLLKGA